ncbi:MAG: cupin domain-containing protein [Planctomycetes bacterium]|nr:cupin domain-containing protein [Planctomycetota bacterium]
MGENEFKIFRKLESGGFENTEAINYKEKNDGKRVSWHKISRTNFIGQFNEPCRFHLRYFSIEPGGYSSFEKHQHIHAVICETGSGLVLINDKWHELNAGDVAYIGSEIPHQLRCEENAQEQFSFFCIVDSVRDKPTILDNLRF